MKSISKVENGIFVISLHLDKGNFILNLDRKGGGCCISSFKETCDYCGEVDCYGECDKSLDNDIDSESRRNYNTMMDAIESLILAHACAGVNVEDKKYMEGIQTAIEACANNCQAF